MKYATIAATAILSLTLGITPRTMTLDESIELMRSTPSKRIEGIDYPETRLKGEVARALVSEAGGAREVMLHSYINKRLRVMSAPIRARNRENVARWAEYANELKGTQLKPIDIFGYDLPRQFDLYGNELPDGFAPTRACVENHCVDFTK